MGIDVTDLVHSLGIKVSGAGENRLTNYSSNQGGKAAKPAGFASNVVHSAADIAGGLAKSFVGGAAKSFTDTARGITQGLPGIGSIAQNQRYVDHSLKQISAAQESYTRAHSEGRISNDRYKALLRDLGKQYDEISGQSKKNADTVSPTDFAAGLATVGTLPLAGGRLVNAGIAAKSPLLASTTSRSLASAAAVAPFKAVGNALTAQSGAQIPGQIKKGDYAGAAGNAALLASPLLIAGAGKALPALSKAAGEAVYGKSSFLDNIPTKDAKITQFLGTLKGKTAEKYSNLAKQFQEYNLQQSRGGVNTATTKYLDWVGRDKAANLTAKQHLDLFKKFSDDISRVRQAAADGTLAKPGGGAWSPEEIKNLWVGRFDQSSKKTLIDQLKAVPTEERGRVAATLANKEQWGKNTLLRDRVLAAAEKPNFEKAIGKLTGTRSLEAPTASQLKIAKIQKGQKANPAQAELDQVFGKPAEVKLNQGHIPILRKEVRTQIPTDVANVKLESGKDALPGLKFVGDTLKKAGLSTQSNNPEVYAKYRANLTDELKKLGLNFNVVQDALEKYTHSASGVGVLDERQLGNYSLMKALSDAGVKSQSEANQVRKAILRAYDHMTFGDLSAAGKLENALYKTRVYGGYRRIQGAGRYQLNPFFRLQQNVEAELFSQTTAKGKSPNLPGTNFINSIFRSDKQDELQGISKLVAKELGEGASGAGAQNTSLGVITAKLTRTQEYSLGGLVKSMAKAAGKSPKEFIKSADQQTLDNIRKVVQYPREGFTSSNFAKTMNMFIFPSRYTVKLTGMAGKILADMPPALQIGTLKGISDFSNFLNTDAGIKWQSDNSEVLGVINYLNPFNNITKVLQGLKTNDLQISDFGMIGGLPLGVITQILKSQGIVNTSSPYLNPKTGEVVPDQLPANTAGAVKLALADIVNQMYSFPGRTFGITTSKKDLTQMVPGIKPGKGETTPAPVGKLSPTQQRTQAVLSQAKTSSVTPGAPKIRKETPYNLNALSGVPRNVSLPGPAAKKPKKVKAKAFRPRPL